MSRLRSTEFQLKVLRRRLGELTVATGMLAETADMLAENTGAIASDTRKPSPGVTALIQRRAARLEKQNKPVEALLLLRKHGG
jgi:hypothetical protein